MNFTVCETVSNTMRTYTSKNGDVCELLSYSKLSGAHKDWIDHAIIDLDNLNTKRAKALNENGHYVHFGYSNQSDRIFIVFLRDNEDKVMLGKLAVNLDD